jgi:hypothetical protein
LAKLQATRETNPEKQKLNADFFPVLSPRLPDFNNFRLCYYDIGSDFVRDFFQKFFRPKSGPKTTTNIRDAVINEVFTADIEVRLRSSEASFMLRLFRKERAAGRPATIAMLNAEVMKTYGPHLVVLEESADGEFTFLYAGARIPDDNGSPLSGETTSSISPATAEMFRIGCRDVHDSNDVGPSIIRLGQSTLCIAGNACSCRWKTGHRNASLSPCACHANTRMISCATSWMPRPRR